MAAKALQASEEGRLTFNPPSKARVFRHWLENIRDWCISRQLWWANS